MATTSDVLIVTMDGERHGFPFTYSAIPALYGQFGDWEHRSSLLWDFCTAIRDTSAKMGNGAGNYGPGTDHWRLGMDNK